MDNIFGIPMTTILIVVVSIMVACLLTTGLIAWRNRIIFRMALRNIPRRKAQSVLIMLGLMLSTMIIAAALTTGDTLNNSTRQATFEGLGEVDQTIAFVGDTGAEGTISLNNVPIRADISGELESALRDDPDVAAIMPVLTVGAPVLNEAAGLSEPSVIVTGIDPGRVDAFGGLVAQDGERIDFAGLPEGTAVISEDLAGELNAEEGDSLTFVYSNEPHTITVGAIAQGSILTGYEASSTQAGPAQTESANLLGLAVPLGWLQDVTGMEGQARFIAVSNSGGVEDGLEQTDSVVPRLRDVLATIEGGEQLGVNPIKQDAIEGAEAFGNVFMGFFVIMGMFSISAGILLIFLIFMMLAAERRSEMGMARAVGMKRSHLIQGFIAEGTAYDLGAALLGSAFGVAAAFAMSQVLGSISDDSVAITPYATPRSLVVAYALGVTITFITVVFASVRSSRLNIVAAIRDLPEQKRPERGERPRWRWWTRLSGSGSGVARAISLPVELVWNVVLVPIKLVIWLVRLLAYVVGWGPMIAATGMLFIGLGVMVTNMFTFSLGLSVLALGLALLLRDRLPTRAVYTVAAAVMLLYWLLPFDVTARVLPDVGEGGPEMLFVSGISMVAFSTLILMWNADLIVRLAALLGRSFSRWLPAVKTAVAYPLASRGRTGLTVAMFAMVIFSIVTVRTISSNFAELLLTDNARAGWDVVVTASPSNPIDDLQAELAGSDVDPERVGAVGHVESVALDNTQLRNSGETDWKRYAINGMDTGFIDNADVPLDALAPGYESDAAVWDALRSGANVAVIDQVAFETDGFGVDPNDYRVPDGVAITEGTFPGLTLGVKSPRTGQVEEIQVIGVIDASVSTLGGIYLPQQVFGDLIGAPDVSRFYVQDAGAAGTNPEDLAQQIESALQTSGVQAESIRAQIEEQQEAANTFFTLLQGFMALGLFVGIAALGVISFRSVVERRQQIGMLRAIGYRRNMVAASFLLESLVVAGLGVVSGAALAIALSYNLISGGEMGVEFETFVIPWSTIALFVASSLVAAAIMTWIPARKAASVPIAEALRYE